MLWTRLPNPREPRDSAVATRDRGGPNTSPVCAQKASGRASWWAFHGVGLLLRCNKAPRAGVEVVGVGGKGRASTVLVWGVPQQLKVVQ